jgi:hypothetical protein
MGRQAADPAERCKRTCALGKRRLGDVRGGGSRTGVLLGGHDYMVTKAGGSGGSAPDKIAGRGQPIFDGLHLNRPRLPPRVSDQVDAKSTLTGFPAGSIRSIAEVRVPAL